MAGSNRDYTINSNVLNSIKCNHRNTSEVQREQKEIIRKVEMEQHGGGKF